MSIATERIQNYYQYKDAESKFYQVIKANLIKNRSFSARGN